MCLNETEEGEGCFFFRFFGLYKGTDNADASKNPRGFALEGGNFSGTRLALLIIRTSCVGSSGWFKNACPLRRYDAMPDTAAMKSLWSRPGPGSSDMD